MGVSDFATLRTLAAQRKLEALLEAVITVVEPPPTEPQPEYHI